MSTVVDPTVRQRLRRRRALLAIGAVALAVIALLAWAGSGTKVGALDPESATPSGTRALAEVLRREGVDVVVVRRADEVPRAVASAREVTLVVAGPLPPSAAMARAALATPPDGLVLVEPGEELLSAAAPSVATVAFGGGSAVEPECADRAALRAGSLDLGGAAYTVAGPAERCYPATVVSDAVHPDRAASLLRLPAVPGRPDTTVLGDATVLTNARLAEGGNAALALDTLGRTATLVWYVPSAADPLLGPAEPTSPLDLLPPGVAVLALGLGLAGLLLAVARGRRLGPVVTEPLPVVVRAAETTRGRARLYRRGHDRAHAAAALRADAVRTCAAALNLPRGAATADVVAAVAARTHRPVAEVVAVLDGPAPPDDTALVRLADDLDTLRKEVRRT